MSASPDTRQTIRSLSDEGYKYGFVTDIEADTAPPVGECANPVRRWQGQAIAANQDKVVAEPVHFRERNAHGVIDPGSE